MKNEKLYQAILNRHSVRRYQQEQLTDEQISTIESMASNFQPLSDNNQTHFEFLNNLKAADLMAAQGPYGRFVVSPHVVLPHCTGSVMPLVEIGFQAEQFCVRLCEMGLGTCYLGTAGREKSVMRHFNLPRDTEMGAAIVYGIPRDAEKDNLTGYFQMKQKPIRRKDLSEILSVDAFGVSGSIPAALEPIMKAARFAPSAVNSQPWRFVLSAGWLYLFVVPAVYPFVLSSRSKLTYALHDAGIVMANISLAYESEGIFCRWILHETDQGGYPSVPNGVIPVAKIEV